jgi:cytochrome b561
MIAFGIYMDDLPDGSRLKKTIYPLHSGLGLVILALVVWRSVLRIRRGFLEPAGRYPVWQNHLARTVHWLLLTVLVMPLAGIAHALGKARESASSARSPWAG